jgi:hypothetical protein
LTPGQYRVWAFKPDETETPKVEVTVKNDLYTEAQVVDLKFDALNESSDSSSSTENNNSQETDISSDDMAMAKRYLRVNNLYSIISIHFYSIQFS